MRNMLFLAVAVFVASSYAQPADSPMVDTVVIINNQPGHMITGFVTQYTNYDSTLVVKVFSREDTIKLTPMTKVTKKGKKTSTSNLERDEQVSVWYTNVNGQNIASKVDLKPGGKTKGAGAPDTGMKRD